ncbi:MAG: Spy/CpxP family protein refolding chaperone [Pyrinomonadaceae bacterium]
MRLSKSKVSGAVLAFAAALSLSVIAFAQQGERRGPGGPPPDGRPGEGRMGPGGRRGDVLGPVTHELNLTDAQKAQIKQIADSFEESTKSLREQMFKAGGTPFDGLDGNFDEATARAAAQARASVQVELDVAHAKMLSQVYALLTADQKAKLAELRQQFAQGHRPPPPPQP